jgi:hypothetical protein
MHPGTSVRTREWHHRSDHRQDDMLSFAERGAVHGRHRQQHSIVGLRRSCTRVRHTRRVRGIVH